MADLQGSKDALRIWNLNFGLNCYGLIYFPCSRNEAEKLRKLKLNMGQRFAGSMSNFSFFRSSITNGYYDKVPDQFPESNFPNGQSPKQTFPE